MNSNSVGFDSRSKRLDDDGHVDDDRHFHELDAEEQSRILEEIETADRMVKFYDRRIDDRTMYILSAIIMSNLIITTFFTKPYDVLPFVLSFTLAVFAGIFLLFRMLPRLLSVVRRS